MHQEARHFPLRPDLYHLKKKKSTKYNSIHHWYNMAGNKQAHSLKTDSYWAVIKAVCSGGEKHPESGNGP